MPTYGSLSTEVAIPDKESEACKKFNVTPTHFNLIGRVNVKSRFKSETERSTECMPFKLNEIIQKPSSKSSMISVWNLKTCFNQV